MSEKLENLETTSLLLDFYGELLPKRQREYIRLYHEDNYSLQEIADEYGLTRQGVSDAVKKAEKALRGYEDKLKLYARFKKSEEQLGELLKDYSSDRQLCERLEALWHLKD